MDPGIDIPPSDIVRQGWFIQQLQHFLLHRVQLLLRPSSTIPNVSDMELLNLSVPRVRFRRCRGTTRGRTPWQSSQGMIRNSLRQGQRKVAQLVIE